MAKSASATSASARIAPAPYAKSAAERLRMLLVQCGMTAPSAWGMVGEPEDEIDDPAPQFDPNTPDSPLSVFESWMASDEPLPAGAERFEAAARAALAGVGVSAERLAPFAEDGTPESDFLRHAMHLFTGAHPDLRAWGAARLKKITSRSDWEVEHQGEGQTRFRSALRGLALAQGKTPPSENADGFSVDDGLRGFRPYGRNGYIGRRERHQPVAASPAHVFFGNALFEMPPAISQAQIQSFNALPHDEQTQRVADQQRWRLNQAHFNAQVNAFAPSPFSNHSKLLNAFLALADAALDASFLQNPENWIIGVSTPRQAQRALEWVCALHRMARGEASQVGDSEILAPFCALDAAIAELDLNSAGLHFDPEFISWLNEELDASHRMDTLAASHAWTVCLRAPSQARAFSTHLRQRLEAPRQSLSEDPTLEEAFAGWTPPPAPGATPKQASANPETGLDREAVEAQAREMGSLGELAIQTARVFCLAAPTANALVGAARNALISEAGWTAGVWRLAANSPEFARSCAHALASQASSIQNKRRAMIRNGVFDNDDKFGALVEMDLSGAPAKPRASLAEEQKQFKQWLKKKKLSLLGVKQSRALMALGHAAMVRNGDQSSFFGLAECLASPSRDTHHLGQIRSWLVDILAGCAPALNLFDAGPERAIRQALQEQQAGAALAPVWAAAFAEGWGQKAQALGKPPQQATKKGAASGTGSDAQTSTAHQQWVGVHFLEEISQLRDCVCGSPGFMQALPKKFNWAFLTRAQQRWHEERGRDEFSKSKAASLSWTPAAVDFSAGAFTATPLTDARALFDEGKAMHHCVFSYADSCHSGEERIVSIQRNGQRVSTLEIFPRGPRDSSMRLALDGSNAGDVHSWAIGQNQGPCNSKIQDAETLAFCGAYLAHLAEHAQTLREEAREKALLSLSGKTPRPKLGLVADEAVAAPTQARRPNRGA